MKVEIFSLCDFACTDLQSKMTIVGIFDRIMAHSAPAAHGLFALAIRMRFGRIEEGQKKIKITFVDSDGRLILPSIETQMVVQIPPGQSETTAHVVSIVSQLLLPRFGEYSVDLAIDGRQEASTPLFFLQLQQPSHPPQTPQQNE